MTTIQNTGEGVPRAVPQPAIDARRLSLVSQSTIALGSIALLGLHIADDSFIQPEPGTSRLSTTSQAASYRSARSGSPWSAIAGAVPGAATIAIVVGLFALVIGAASGGYGVVTGGLSGDGSPACSRFWPVSP